MAPEPAGASRRSVAAPASASGSAAAPPTGESPWASPEACTAALERGEGLTRAANAARIGTWNIRWFPDGAPGKRPKHPRPTNIGWLACAIAWLGVDVLAVQELKAHPPARAALGRLLAELDRLTKGSWKAELDACKQEPIQHVGLLYDARRVRARGFTTVGALNPHGEACEKLLRPGLSGHFTFPGGLSTHVVSVHLKSGKQRRSIDLRRESLRSLAAARHEIEAALPDEDIIVAGDLNTMGCPRCSPEIEADLELEEAKAALSSLPSPFRLVPSTKTCSEYYKGRGTLLDHFVVSGEMKEVRPDARARVAGYCNDTACRVVPRRKMPRAHEELSDHCPVVLDVEDRDLR